MRIAPLAVAGWVVAAGLTLGVSWSAVQVVRSAVAPADLTAADSLPPPSEPSSTVPSGTASRTPTATATTPAGRTGSGSGTGGTVVVRCAGGTSQLVRAVPRQGFSMDTHDSPVEVKFTSDGHRTEIKATCPGGQPRFSVEEDDRGGGNSGPGGGHDSGGDNSGPGGGQDN